MKKLVLILALFALQACTGESSLPSPTGKGTFRAINAIEGSPNISFLIEERELEFVQYKSATSTQRFDDFEYNFHFQVLVLGEDAARRVATITQKIDADRDYTFVASGNLLSPTVTIWQTDERTFDDAGTIFEVRFGHISESLGTVDVYFDAPGIAPVVGNQRGTLAFGDVLNPLDLEAGDYVLTYTAPNDPNTVLYQSGTVTYGAGNANLIPVFDGDEQDTSQYSVRLITQSGIAALPDALSPPTVRIFQAAITLDASDVYDDENVTNLVLPNHQFGDVTGDLPIAAGVTNYTYTAVGNSSAVQFESGIDAVPGTRNNFIVIGDMDDRVATTFVPDRRSVSTSVRMRLYHAAMNLEELDWYIVESGTSIDDDDVNRTLGLIYSLQTPTLTFQAGSYDVYVTLRGEKTVVAGPVTVDTALGDILEFVLFDTVDPALAELRLIPPP